MTGLKENRNITGARKPMRWGVLATALMLISTASGAQTALNSPDEAVVSASPGNITASPLNDPTNGVSRATRADADATRRLKRELDRRGACGRVIGSTDRGMPGSCGEHRRALNESSPVSSFTRSLSNRTTPFPRTEQQNMRGGVGEGGVVATPWGAGSSLSPISGRRIKEQVLRGINRGYGGRKQ